MNTVSHMHDDGLRDNESLFDVKKEAAATIKELEKGSIKRPIATVSIFLAAMIVVEGIEWVTTGDQPNPDAFFGMLYVLVAFNIYLYMFEILSVKLNMSRQLFLRYTRHLIKQDPNINKFKEADPDKLVDELEALNGLNYGQLSQNQKDLVAYSVANEYYLISWLFSKKTLGQMKGADNNADFYLAVNNKDDVINSEKSAIAAMMQAAIKKNSKKSKK